MAVGRVGTTSRLSEVIDYELRSWIKEGLWYKMCVLKRRELEVATCKNVSSLTTCFLLQ